MQIRVKVYMRQPRAARGIEIWRVWPGRRCVQSGQSVSRFISKPVLEAYPFVSPCIAAVNSAELLPGRCALEPHLLLCLHL